MTCASVVGTCAATLVLSAGTAAAAPRVVPLPTPLQRLSTQPPLQGGTVIAPEGLRHRVRAVERVNVDVDARGVPFAVVLVDRLTVLDKGDYNFAIPAPVVDVRAAAGSVSQPGQRTGAILWAGFNPRRKVLAAQARLRTSDAARFLPLRIQIDQLDSHECDVAERDSGRRDGRGCRSRSGASGAQSRGSAQRGRRKAPAFHRRRRRRAWRAALRATARRSASARHGNDRRAGPRARSTSRWATHCRCAGSSSYAESGASVFA